MPRRLLVMLMCGTVLVTAGAVDATAQRAARTSRPDQVAARSGRVRAQKPRQKLTSRLRRLGRGLKRNLRRSPEAWSALRVVRTESRAHVDSAYGDPARAAELLKTARPEGLRARLELSYARKKVDRAVLGASFETTMEAMHVVADLYRRGQVTNLGMTGKYVTRYLDAPRGDARARRTILAEARAHGVDLAPVLAELPSWRHSASAKDLEQR